MPDTSRLVRMRIHNLGCIGPEGCMVALDDILCLVGCNNTGKSTILRAYELALGTQSFDPAKDLCRRAADAPSAVEIWVHIPEGMANIAEKWKVTDGPLRLVQSKWEWSKDTNWTRTRTTWDPEINEYSTNDNASGLDTVFSSRLPKPFRIGSLEEPEVEHKQLLTLVLQPIAAKLEKQKVDGDSELRKAITAVERLARGPVNEERERLDGLKADLNRSHNAIFPDLKMDFEIGIGDVDFNPLQMLLKNSKLKFMDWHDEVSWTQQGTGSQRALFWTMLQVRSRLKAVADIAERQKKNVIDLQRTEKKLQGEAEKAKREETKQAKSKEIAEVRKSISDLSEAKPEELLAQDAQALSLPGYMLLIDEPEIALHPNAIRAASRYLYSLTDDRTWQVMLATHSPLFIDPLHDHTTIVRLTRSQANPTPKIYRSDTITFSPDEKENLKILNRFDCGLSEMFFGQMPLLVEGDTEYAAFELLMNKYPLQFPVSQKPVLVRARGKHAMLLVIRVLSEFKVPFAILHDADTPYLGDGRQNGAWSANSEIYDAVQAIRALGVRVVHRISVPGFEYVHLPLQYSKGGELKETAAKDKPWQVVRAIESNAEVKESILSVLRDLISADADETPLNGDFMESLTGKVQEWAKQHCIKDIRFG